LKAFRAPRPCRWA